MTKHSFTTEKEIASLVNRLHGVLHEEGVTAYLVGGLVRDMLLGRATADVDIALAADALEVTPRLATTLGGRFVPLDEVNRIGRLILTDDNRKWEIDFATLRGSIKEDLAQRDFTVNAMAIELKDEIENLSTNDIIDPFQGREDLKKGAIRAVSASSLEADPARLLRAVRLAAEMDFTITPETETLIRSHSSLLRQVAGERVREELLRLLALPGAGRVLAYLDGLELLTAIIPELSPARGVDQPTVHFWDVFEHSRQTVTALEFLLRQGEWEYATAEMLPTVPWSPELEAHFNQEVSAGSTRKTLLKLAALLHDIAKPQTKTIADDGRARFLGHTSEGASTITSILERLRFSNREIKMAALVVLNHLRPQQMSSEGMPSRRAIYRYFRDTGETGIDILFLSLADHLAARGPHLDFNQWQEHTRLVTYVLTEHSREQSVITPPKLIDGHDLIHTFGLPPGPEIGRILEATREGQAAGEIKTREEALEYIRHLPHHRREPQERNG